jgi:hypothetical protein
MFKEKIVEGLRAKSEIKRFGLSNEAIDRIASEREKTVTEESQVETVLTDAETMRLIAEELMKHRDQEITKRTEAQNAFEDYKAKHPEKSDPDPDPDPNPDPNKQTPLTAEAIAKLVKDAATEAVKAVKDDFDAYKAQISGREAVAAAKAKFYENKWTTKFKDEADDAWTRAHELHEAGGGKMSQEELTSKATEYFNLYVQRKGTDATKPFEEGGGADGNFDFSAQKKHLQETGKLPEDNK